MVKYYNASTAESGWDIDKDYRGLMTGLDNAVLTGASYKVKLTRPLYAPFLRDDEFYFCQPGSDKQTVFTDGISGCAAVVYFYRLGTAITLAAMGHINCGKFEHADKGPFALARKNAFVDFDAIDVVIAHGSSEKYTACLEYVVKDGVDQANVLDYFDPLIKDFAATASGCIGRCQWGVVSHTPEPEIEKKRRRKCFLTTAACISLGLSDDCAELNDMRRFRDDVLSRMPGGLADIEAYYRIAPRLVAAIDASPDADRIYRDLYSDWIAPVLADIRAGANRRALERYRRMVDSLVSRYPAAMEKHIDA